MKKPQRTNEPVAGPARSRDSRDENPDQSRLEWEDFFTRCDKPEIQRLASALDDDRPEAMEAA